jgi:NADH:ubiquinone reductase (H+-translocating)
VTRHRVVIVGGGFGGLNAARGLAAEPVDVTVVDRANHHLFQPLLYQVATGILSEGVVAPALRGVLRRQKNAEVVLGEVEGFDLERRLVRAVGPDGRPLSLSFDSLIVATGVQTSYFGHDEWEAVAPGLKTLEDARWVRTHILGAFEMAELATDPAEKAAWLTFVIVGAGATGVEMTGEIATLARRILPRDFRRVATRDARIVLIDAGPDVLPSFPEKLRRRVATDLSGWGVEIRTGTTALDIETEGIDLRRPDGETERVAAHTIIWAAGVKAAPPAEALAAASGAATDRAGRLEVLPDLTLPGHPDVFAVGDMMTLDGLPGVAPVAMQQGRYAAAVVAARLAGREPPPPFHYKDKGSMAQVGPRRAVVDAFGLQVGGLFGSLMWAFVHVMYLVGWGNRLVTVVRWVFQMTTRNRSQRVVDVEQAATWGTVRAGRGRRAGSLWSGMRKNRQ